MRALLFTITLSIITSTHAAEIYRWVDENGKVHFTDKKPGQEKQAEEVKPNISRPQEPDEGEIRRRPSGKRRAGGKRQTAGLSHAGRHRQCS